MKFSKMSLKLNIEKSKISPKYILKYRMNKNFYGLTCFEKKKEEIGTSLRFIQVKSRLTSFFDAKDYIDDIFERVKRDMKI